MEEHLLPTSSAIQRHFTDLFAAQLVKKLLLVCTALILSACELTPLQPPQTLDAEQSWRTRQQTLSALSAWGLSGRIAIQTPAEGWHASLSWEQRGETYSIQLSSPLGQGALQLNGDSSQVTLRTANAEDTAQDPEALLERQLGWRIPVSGLRYWVLGLPDPGVPLERKQLDESGRLTRIQQSGWDVEFRHYTSTGSVDLPDKLFLNNASTEPHLEVRLAVERWDLK